MSLGKFQASGASIYDRLFDESDEDNFEVPPGITNYGVIRKLLPVSAKLYFFQ